VSASDFGHSSLLCLQNVLCSTYLPLLASFVLRDDAMRKHISGRCFDDFVSLLVGVLLMSLAVQVNDQCC